MKRKMFLLLILMLSIRVFPQDPGKIVNQCVNVLGGEEAVRLFSDYRGEGPIVLHSYGFELKGNIKIIRKGRKSWTRSDIDLSERVLTIIEAFDGQNAWRESWGEITDNPTLNFESDLDHTVAILLEKEAVFSRSKDTEIEGRKAVGIKVALKGKNTHFFIDRENFTILEIVYKDTYFSDDRIKEVLERRIRYGDYKKFANVLFPTKIVIYQRGKKQKEYRLEKVTFKPDIPSSRFKRPEEELDLRYYEERIY